MPISITEISKIIAECCNRKLDSSPVCVDLPRLARHFILQVYKDNKFHNWPFAKDVQKDSMPVVIHGLISNLFTMLMPERASVKQQPTLDIFLKEVNIEIEKSLQDYLCKYYGGDTAPINRMLKAANQSVVVGVLSHISKVLLEKQIRFKDVRPSTWTIYFHTGDSGKQPSIKHRRKEQIFELIDGRIELKQKFEWECEVKFDSLEMNEIVGVGIRILNVEGDQTDAIAKKLKEAVPDKKNDGLRIKVK